VKIHFFLTPEEEPDEYFETWTPDANPRIYASGIGHNVLELASRLRAQGHSTSLGQVVPSDSQAVIFFKKHFLLQRGLTLKILMIAIRHPVILIRSDLQLEVPLIFCPDLEVMPNKSVIKKRSQVYIPPLPQRGLIRRDKRNGNRIKNLEIKCNPENIPDSLESLIVEVKRIDPTITVKVDSPKYADGSDNYWNDFSKVDLNLIIRPVSQTSESNARKPPTRLINAWVAGTIPVVDPLPAYIELIRDGIDGFVVNQPIEVAAVVKKLMENPDYCGEVFDNCRKRGEEYRAKEIVEIWEYAVDTVSKETNVGLRRTARICFEFMLAYLRK
jgi:hypothetical protein